MIRIGGNLNKWFFLTAWVLSLHKRQEYKFSFSSKFSAEKLFKHS